MVIRRAVLYITQPVRKRFYRNKIIVFYIDELMGGHDGNIKYDKYTGEIQYDGVNAPDSDVR